MKKWTVKMKTTARTASSPWITVAMLKTQPGRTFEKTVGNQSMRPDPPMIPMPQKTAQ